MARLPQEVTNVTEGIGSTRFNVLGRAISNYAVYAGMACVLGAVRISAAIRSVRRSIFRDSRCVAAYGGKQELLFKGSQACCKTLSYWFCKGTDRRFSRFTLEAQDSRILRAHYIAARRAVDPAGVGSSISSIRFFAVAESPGLPLAIHDGEGVNLIGSGGVLLYPALQ